MSCKLSGQRLQCFSGISGSLMGRGSSKSWQMATGCCKAVAFTRICRVYANSKVRFQLRHKWKNFFCPRCPSGINEVPISPPICPLLWDLPTLLWIMNQLSSWSWINTCICFSFLLLIIFTNNHEPLEAVSKSRHPTVNFQNCMSDLTSDEDTFVWAWD